MTVPTGNDGASLETGLVYFIKAFVGPGCLSLPLAFQNCGVVLGSFLLLSVSAMVTYNLRTMVLCKQHLAHKGIRTYADLTKETLGDSMRRIVEIFINGVQLGICAVYFDFFAENARALLPHLSLYTLMLLIFPVYAALALLESIDSIAPYAALANALVYLAIGIVLFSAVATIHKSFWGPDEAEPILFADASRAPLFYATVIYSFEGVCSLLPVENALARPETDMPTVMYAGMIVVTLTYGTVGAVSYVAWPTVASGSITAEVSRRAGHGEAAWLVALVSNVSTIVAVVLTFPVQLFPSIELLEQTAGLSRAGGYVPVAKEDILGQIELAPSLSSSSKGDRKDDNDDDALLDNYDDEPVSPQGKSAKPPRPTSPLKRSCFRIVIVVGIGLVAALVPDLGALIDLIGALTGSALSIVVPALIDLKCPRPGRRRWEFFVDCALILLGVIGGITGTFQAIVYAANSPTPGILLDSAVPSFVPTPAPSVTPVPSPIPNSTWAPAVVRV